MAAFAGPLAAKALAATTSAEPEYRVDLSVITGLGAEEYPGFPADVCPEELPDLSRHHNLLADALKRDAALYEAHRTGRTKSGVSFAKCIKMGLDNPGHPMIKTVDMCAGDEECYVTFAAVHQPILAKKHHLYSEEAGHRTDLDASKTDREGQLASYVESITVQAKRNLAGVRFTTAASLEERVEVEPTGAGAAPRHHRLRASPRRGEAGDAPRQHKLRAPPRRGRAGAAPWQHRLRAPPRRGGAGATASSASASPGAKVLALRFGIIGCEHFPGVEELALRMGKSDCGGQEQRLADAGAVQALLGPWPSIEEWPLCSGTLTRRCGT